MENSNYQIVHQYITEIMPKIERPPLGKILYPWLCIACGENYSGTIWTWDMHHSAMRFAIAGKPEYLRHMVDNLLAYQLDDGHVPNVVSVDKGPRYLDLPFHAQPFLFQAAFLYVKQTGDKVWGESVFGKLTKFLDYYDKYHSAAFELKRWRTGWMGGFDNDVATAFLPPETIATSDINSWFYIDLLAAQKLSVLLERSEDADAFALRAKKQREATNNKLWYDEVKSYTAFRLCDDSPLFRLLCEGDLPSNIGQFSFQTASNLIPLYGRMAEADSAAAMIKKYVISKKHFWSNYGIRSLSRSSEYYNNAVLGNPSRFGDYRRMEESNWQGPVWVPLCYFTFQALRHYGFVKEATLLADNVIDLLANSLKVQGSFSENYNAETGEPLYATNIASWNLLADTMHDDLISGNWIMDAIFQRHEVQKL